MSALCTNAACGQEAECVMAVSGVLVPCVFVAPYCARHGKQMIAEGRGAFASGPALSEKYDAIQGIRRFEAAEVVERGEASR
jgi:hypothetical protein